jgi:hypothetical protein
LICCLNGDFGGLDGLKGFAFNHHNHINPSKSPLRQGCKNSPIEGNYKKAASKEAAQ